MKKHAPTAFTLVKVETMAGLGARYEHIAEEIGVSVGTLVKYYREQLDTGRAKADLMVTNAFFKIASSDQVSGASVTAKIFWLKCRCGWKETARNEPPDERDIEREDPLEKLARLLAQHQERQVRRN